MPDVMGWDEAVGHLKILTADPSSMIASSLQGWAFPVSREALVLMDLFDLEHAVNANPKSRPKPHSGRPWETKDESTTRRGNAAGRSREEVIEILNAHGHSIPV